jgi:hypothetical protein
MNRASFLAAPWRVARLLCLLALVFLAAPRAARAQATATPPNLMTYQGYLVDGNGNALATNAPANYVVRFRIFNAGTGGTKLWGEEQTVTVDKGYFSVVLGEGTAEPDNIRPPLGSVFASSTASDRFIETTVVIGVTPNPLAPRLRLMPSPYAFLATSAGQLVNAQGGTFLSSTAGTVTVAGILSGNGSGLTSLAPTSIAGTLAANQIPILDASKVTTGVLGLGRIPTLDAGRIPNLDALKISSGVLDAARIPATLTGNRFFTANVGIGTSTPNDGLQVGDFSLPANRYIVTATAGGTQYRTGIKLRHFNMNYGWTVESDERDQSFRILQHLNNTAGTTRLAINSSGNVGIGTLTPNDGLQVGDFGLNGNRYIVTATAGLNQHRTGIKLRHFNMDYGWTVESDERNDSFGILQHINSAAGTHRFFIQSGGNVGIGSTAPARKLHVAGDMRVDGWIYQTFDNVEYRLDRNAFDGVARWNNSDARLKERITTIPAARHTLGKLRGVTWQWNETGLERFTKDLKRDYRSASGRPEDDEKIWEEKRREILQEHSKVQFGFLAQEVEAVFPDWVSTGKDGYKQINMERLSAVLVNAINEQQQQIEALQTAQAAQLATLQARNEGLERQVAELTARQAGLEETLEARTAALERLVGKLTRAQAEAAPATPALLLEESTAPATVILNR